VNEDAATKALEHVGDSHVLAATFNQQLLVGAGMIALCVLIHGFGLFGLQRALFTESMKERMKRLPPLSLRGSLFTLVIVFSLIGLHFVEIWLFAFLYVLLNALHNFPDALYFSTITYATLGYSDTTMAREWRMVGALEGIMGVILLGWSTAFFVRILNRLEDSGSSDEVEHRGSASGGGGRL
jgi:hypothetical protein